MSSSEDPFLLHHHNLLYHVPQHSRREKLRFQTDSSSLPNPMAHFTAGTGLLQIQPPQGNFSLTLSPAAALLPLGPFTGYAAVLNRSRFLDPARQLLEEVCEVAGGEQFAGDPPEVMSLDYEVGPDDQQWKKARLISMIDEVCRRYRIYYQQVQNVITSFEMVAGLRTAAPYVSLALSSMSKHFRCLKNMMSNQLNVTNKDSGKEGISRTEISSFGMCLQQDGNSNNLDSYRQPHAWRPQRGLPERAIAVLRAWLFEHFLHPYPTDVDKQMLAKQAGLTRNQVSNWFINARVRLWKPMVEEIHNLEMRQLQKTVAPNNKNQIAHNKQASKPSSSTATSSSNQPPQNSFIQRNQNPSSRSLNNELDYIAHHIEEPFKYAYNDFSSQDVGRNTGSVSLTLGLHQNSGVCLPEPLPLNVARRFGLEDCNDTYVVGAFEGQDRRFGKDIGGHLLHDFVG